MGKQKLTVLDLRVRFKGDTGIHIQPLGSRNQWAAENGIRPSECPEYLEWLEELLLVKLNQEINNE